MELSLVWLLIALKGALPVELGPLKVPHVIQNGTLNSVILDCPYTLHENEKDSLVLKWYLNSHTVPIYQWIPPSPPQGLGSMRHKLNLDYKISNDPYQAHRALFIMRPNIEMSGEYLCKASTLQNEASKSSNMIVYIPPRSLFIVSRRASYSSVNVSCTVDHTFPRPVVRLYKGQERSKVNGLQEKVVRYPDGDYKVTVYTILEDATLDLENLFECEMYLPKTDFRLAKSTIYSPKHPAVLARSDTLMNKALSFKSGMSLLLCIVTVLSL